MWQVDGRNRPVSATKLARTDVEKMKRRADLLIFSERYPGALTAHFFNTVRVKGLKGPVTQSKHLREVDVSTHVVNGHVGVTELRDTREAMTIGMAMDLVNRGCYEKALDVLTMRLVALSRAKAKGGSWEKAQRGELIPEPGCDMGPAGLAGLFA